MKDFLSGADAVRSMAGFMEKYFGEKVIILLDDFQ